MTTYSFDTITAAQAAAFQVGDDLTFPTGHATEVTVLYGPSTISILLNGRTVDFSAQLAAPPQSARTFADGSLLWIGNGVSNSLGLTNVFDTHAQAIFGGDGDDQIRGASGGDLLQGNGGNDQIAAGPGSNTIYGGQGNDNIQIASGGAVGVHGSFAQGNKGDDAITGGNGPDTLLGGQGNDVVYGSGGADFINGNLGDDTLNATGDGAQIFGEDGNDRIGLGGFLDTGSASQTAHGGAGNDVIVVGFASTFSDVGWHDSIWGDDGNDSIESDSALSDDLHGGVGDDTIVAGGFLPSGGDTLDGGDGNDSLEAGQDGNVLSGGAGDDTLQVVNGTGPADTISGGAGSDLFILGLGRASSQLAAKIIDWSSQHQLRFQNLPTTGVAFATGSAATFTEALAYATPLIQAHAEVVAVEVGLDVFIFAGNGSVGTAVELVGRSLADIAPGNIV